APVRAAGRHLREPRHDVLARVGELAPARGVAPDRPRDLLLLRAPAQPAVRRRLGRGSSSLRGETVSATGPQGGADNGISGRRLSRCGHRATGRGGVRRGRGGAVGANPQPLARACGSSMRRRMLGGAHGARTLSGGGDPTPPHRLLLQWIPSTPEGTRRLALTTSAGTARG